MGKLATTCINCKEKLQNGLQGQATFDMWGHDDDYIWW